MVLDETAREEIGRQNVNNRVALAIEPRDRAPRRRPLNLWRAQPVGDRAPPTPAQPLARAQQVGDRVPPRRPFNLWRARNRLTTESRRDARSTSGARATGWRPSPAATPVQPVARAQPVGHRAPRRRPFNRWHARNRSVTEPLAAARSFRWHARNRSVTEPLAAARSFRWHARNRPVTEPLAAARSFRCGQSELPHQDHDGGLHRGRRLDPAPARP